MFVKRNLILYLSIFLSLCFQVQASEVTLVTHEYKPYSWVDEKGEIRGLAVDIADLVFERSGIKKSWKIVPLKRAYKQAQTIENTCIFPLQRNQEREADFKWLSPILINRYAFYTPKGRDMKLRTLADLKGLKVVSYLGSGLSEYLNGFGIHTIETFKDNLAANMVSIGRADVWATDIFSKPYIVESRRLEFDQKFIFFTSIGAMACNRKMPQGLVDTLQKHLSELYRNGEIAKIVRRYVR
jgi:polar amino acid transport system substrate-binding protein